MEFITLLFNFFLSDLIFSKLINKSLLSFISLIGYIEESSLFLLFSHIILFCLCQMRIHWRIFVSFVEIFYRSFHGILVKWLFWDNCLDRFHVFKESWSFSTFQTYKSRELTTYLLLIITVFWHKWNIQILRFTFLFNHFLTMQNFLKSVSISLWSNFCCWK